MKDIPSIFRKFWPQIVYFCVPPVFLVAFILLYSPSAIVRFLDMGEDHHLTLNVAVCAFILLGVLVGFRLMFFFLRKAMHLNWVLYIVWCAGELLAGTAFITFYMTLMYFGGMPFFSILGYSISMVFGIQIYPYAIITLFLAAGARYHDPTAVKDDLIRFQDENKSVKLVIATSAVLYIMAKENYVQIFYIEGERIRNYILRTSMKGIEELVTSHGLVRAHRSYYVNPAHVEILRKDKEGVLLAQLDKAFSGESISVPVSKKYSESLTDKLS